jgi:sn1-specific diacylglycerol lipase
MPHLVFQGRYWKLSGDELVLPSACAACLRLFWICSLAAIISVTLTGLGDCGDGWVIILYLFASIVVCILAVLCEVLLSMLAVRGSMVDSKARGGLGSALNAHMVLGVLQLCCAGVGIAIVARHDFPCSDEFSATWDNVLLLAVVISQLIDMLGIFCCFSMFRSREVTRGAGGEYEDAMDVENPYEYGLDRSKEQWQKRCKTGCKFLQMCTCSLFGGGGIGEELETVGVLFAHFFHHDGFLDVVPSDVAAGLVLVRLQQRARVLSLGTGDGSAPVSPLLGADGGEEGYQSDSAAIMTRRKGVYHHIDPKLLNRRIFDKDEPRDVTLLTDAAHYAPYALAAYTHLMYMFMHPACGPCQLCAYRSCGNYHKKMDDWGGRGSTGVCPSCCNLGTAPIIGDNCCKINQTAMLKMVDNRNGELISANFSNDLDIKPYGVFVDHDRDAVVVTIRGTLSLEDCISDALADAESMAAAGDKWGFDGRNKFAHSGMLRAAMWIRENLRTSGLLAELLPPGEGEGEGDDDSPTDTAVRRPATAEKAGAGTSVGTSNTPSSPSGKKKYRQLVVVGHSLGAGTAAVLAMLLRPAYPSLVSFCYGAPGSVLDESTAREVQSYVTSVVLGKDLVASLSLHNLSVLRVKVLDAIVRCKANKNVVMRAVFQEKAHALDELMYAPGTEPDSEFKSMVEKFNEYMSRRSLDLRREKLFVPGRIIHLVKTQTAKTCCGKRKEYVPTSADLKDFSEIKISPNMVWEHFPDEYCNALDDVVNKWSASS